MGGVRIQDYPTAGYVRIEGVNYSYEFFKMLARQVPLNVPMKITRRDNEKLCIELVKPEAPIVQPKTSDAEVKMETEEVPAVPVYRRNVGRPKKHKMIEEPQEAKE
jgi:hypothetical protein